MAHECWIRPQIRRNSDLFSVNDECSTPSLAPRHSNYALGHRQQIIPVHTLVLADLVVLTYPTSVDHDATVLVRFRIEQVVALRTKMQRSLF